MQSTSELIAIFLLLAVMVVLFLGTTAMVSGRKEDMKESERLMGWRVLLQAVALAVLVLGAVYLF